MPRNVREAYVGLRLTAAEHRKLEAYAEATQETVSGALRRLLNSLVVLPLTGHSDGERREGSDVVA